MTKIIRVSGASETHSSGLQSTRIAYDGRTPALALYLARERMELEQQINRRVKRISSPLDNSYSFHINMLSDAIAAVEAGNPGRLGEMAAHLRAQGIAGAGVGSLSSFFQKVSNTFEQAKDTVLADKMAGVRIMTVQTAPQMSAAFLYLFLTPEQLAAAPEAVKVKRAKAEKKMRWMVNIVQFQPEEFMSLMRNGIMKQTGQTPEYWIEDMLKTSKPSAKPEYVFYANKDNGGYVEVKGSYAYAINNPAEMTARMQTLYGDSNWRYNLVDTEFLKKFLFVSRPEHLEVKSVFYSNKQTGGYVEVKNGYAYPINNPAEMTARMQKLFGDSQWRYFLVDGEFLKQFPGVSRPEHLDVESLFYADNRTGGYFEVKNGFAYAINNPAEMTARMQKLFGDSQWRYYSVTSEFLKQFKPTVTPISGIGIAPALIPVILAAVAAAAKIATAMLAAANDGEKDDVDPAEMAPAEGDYPIIDAATGLVTSLLNKPGTQSGTVQPAERYTLNLNNQTPGTPRTDGQPETDYLPWILGGGALALFMYSKSKKS